MIEVPDPVQYAFRLGQCLYRKAVQERQEAAARAERLLGGLPPPPVEDVGLCAVCAKPKASAQRPTCGDICGRIYRDKRRANLHPPTH